MGEPGRKAVTALLPVLKEELQTDFIIVNGENAAGGRGITPKIAVGLMRAGAAVVTTGDHVWDQKEIVDWFAQEPRLLRPTNYPAGTPGQGSVILDTKKGPVGVINVQGRTFMKMTLDNPFTAMRAEVEEMRKTTKIIFVDVHAETTSEKAAMGWFLDGSVTAVVGTHTHVQTADERILPQGTAFLTDAGMCGPQDSCIGMDPDSVVERFVTLMPGRNYVAKGPVMVNGALVEADLETGKAISITRVQRLWVDALA